MGMKSYEVVLDIKKELEHKLTLQFELSS
jgi:hypothetical protein